MITDSLSSFLHLLLSYMSFRPYTYVYPYQTYHMPSLIINPPQLEYFGRPLGLWRTSHKLAHTLFEVAFICAWSAALSLCFDNFFTSYLPCASLGSISWYNELPHSNTAILPQGTPDYIKHTLCKDQLILIVLVGIGLIVYCLNLVIRYVVSSTDR
jgi:hypothetical protein